jgi:hypothetical protein
LKYLIGALLGVAGVILLKKLLNWLFIWLSRDDY